MKTMKWEGVGSLTILLDFDPYRVQGARLNIPLLGIDQHVGQLTQFETLPTGAFEGTLITFLTSGQEISQPIKVKVLPNQGNLHKYALTGPPQDIIIRPVDSRDEAILFAEVKIEDLDMNFRPVRDDKGVTYKLRPGDYRIKVVLPNLRVKTFPLKITEDVHVYTLLVEGRHRETRRESRIQLAVPAAYQTGDGKWVSTQTTNISGTGLCLIKKQWNLDDENMLVRLFVPISGEPMECPASVRWVRDEGGPSSEIGLELRLSAQSKSALKKWLSENSQKKSG